MHCSRPFQHLPHNVLLPLTAAAGGPGSSLTNLTLSANFVPIKTAVVATNAALVSEWPRALKQLSGLRELVIHQLGDLPLDFPVECLPASLQVLGCRRVNISSSAVVAAPTSSSSDQGRIHIVGASNTGSMPGVPTPPTANCLRSLYLTECHLSSPSILANDLLEQLTVVNSRWSGGRAAAAQAWPRAKSRVHGLESM